MSTPAATQKTFADFGVSADLCKSLEEVGIIHPFPIQELTLPLALTGADIIGQARTGTGKTLGFGLPMLQRLALDGGLQVLIIVPTRELCLQVAEDLAQAGKVRGVKVAALYGGKAMQPQIDALEGGAHVVVGTPGRLLDLSRRGHLNLSGCSGLVLDEADEMLDLGFLPDVEALVEQCAEERQTLLFSATMPAQIVGLARRYMRKPTFMRADVEEVHIAPKTQQFFFSCHRMDKPAVLARILQTPDRGLCVVFCRTKRMADQLAEELRDRDVAAQAIHSDLRQEARERALEKFRQGKTTVLCATEVAARGLDIDDVTHVVNYDCPDDEKMYLHRIGRTGRAGAKGVAITFAVWNELPRLEMIRRELDIEAEVIEVFSTSPLLEELFDLPAREERKKVASPPKARTAKGSRTGKRSGESRARSADTRKDDDQPAGRRPRKSEETEPQARRPRKDEQEGSQADDSQTRTRTRTRRAKSEDGNDAAASSRTGSNDTGSNDTGSNDTGSNDTKASADERPTRTRTRTRTRSDAPRDGSRARTASDPDSREDRDRADDKSDRKTGRDGRQGGRAGDEPAEGRGKQDASAVGDKRGSKERGRSKSSSGEGGEGRSRGGSQGRGRSEGGRSEKGRGQRSDRGGGGRSDRARSDRDRRDGRSGERERKQVDSAEARGEGQPRLKRKMEVVHLP